MKDKNSRLNKCDRLNVLILGSKEYPLGTSDDPIKSGGIEVYVSYLIEHLRKYVNLIIITRKFRYTKSFEEKNGIKIYRVFWIRGFYFRNPSFNFLSFLKAIRLSNDYKIVITNGPVATFFAVILKKLLNKYVIAIPAGIAFKQPQYNRFIKFFLYHLEKIAYRNIDTIIFLSNMEKTNFKKSFGFIPKNNTVIPPGISQTEDLSSISSEKVKEEFNLKGDIVIVFVGRLIRVKGVDVLLLAIKEIDNNIRLLLVGDGPDKDFLLNLSNKLKLYNKVIFLGWRNDVFKILNASDIFVLPSYSEGLPMALLEAMLAGKACIVTDIGLPVNKKIALIFKPGDHIGLRNCLKLLIENPSIRKKLGYLARSFVLKRFSWKNTTLRILTLIQKSNRVKDI